LNELLEREKAEHVRRAVTTAKRGFRRIEKLWDENEIPEVRTESLAAATLDKHDAIIRRNLGMNEAPGGSCSLNLHVLTGGRTIISPQQSIDQSGGIAPEKTISQEPAYRGIAAKVVAICGRLRRKKDFFFQGPVGVSLLGMPRCH